MNLKTKLLGGFFIVSLILALVGMVGWYGAIQMKKTIIANGEVYLPGLQAIGHLRESLLSLKVSKNQLLNVTISLDDRAKEYQKINKIIADANAVMKDYEHFLVTDEQRATWKEFQGKWGGLREKMKEFINHSNDIDSLKVHDPQQFALEAERNFGSYKNWAAQTSRAILEEAGFTGNLSLEKSPFYIWLELVDSTNPPIIKAKSGLQEHIREVYSSVESLVDLLDIKEHALAKEIYVAEVLPSIEKMQVLLDNLLAPVNEALSRFQNLTIFNETVTAKLITDLESSLGDIIAQTESASLAEVKQGEELASLVSKLIPAAIGAGVIMSLLFGVFIAKSITKPIGACVEFAEYMRNKDLSRHIDDKTGGEIGILTKALNVMAINFCDIMKEISTHSTSIARSSDDLSMAANVSATGADEMTAQANNVASATSQLTDNISRVATSSDEMSTSVSSVASSIKNINISLAEVAQNASQGSKIVMSADKQAKEADATMSRLSNTAVEVTKVLETIKDIAEQTNLLALNATIEAASAGDAGKGFAVVANEVKELAKQSAVAAEEIHVQIEEMQNSTSKSVKAIGQIVDIFDEISSISNSIANSVQQQSTAMGEINSNINDASQAADKIAKNASQASVGAKEITANITEVHTVARKSAESASNTNTNAGELAEMAAALQKIVDQFKI